MSSTLPIRCWTCGKEINGKYEEYARKVFQKKEVPDAALDDLYIRRLCCRRMFKTHTHQLEGELMLYDHSKRIFSPLIEIDE